MRNFIGVILLVCLGLTVACCPGTALLGAEGTPAKAAVAGGGSLQSVTAADDAVLRKAAEEFMGFFTNGKFQEASDALMKGYWPVKKDAEAIALKLKSEMERNENSPASAFGKRIVGAYEFVGTIRIGKHVVRLVYIQKYENSYLPFSFEFYKPAEQWKVVNVNYGPAVFEDLRTLAVKETGK